MKEVVEVIAKALVDNPDKVSVEESIDENDGICIALHVAQKDMGKIIGRQGRIAKALRTVVKAAAARANKKVMVDILE